MAVLARAGARWPCATAPGPAASRAAVCLEKGRRHRHWAILPEAKRLLSDARVAELAFRLNKRLRSKGLTSYPPIAHITR